MRGICGQADNAGIPLSLLDGGLGRDLWRTRSCPPAGPFPQCGEAVTDTASIGLGAGDR